MEITRDLAGREAAYLALELEASAPYTSFVYEDRAQAERVQRLLFDRGAAEFARAYGWVCLADGDIVGMIAFASGDDLQKSRLKAAFGLRAAGREELTADVVRRISLAGRTLARIGSGDLYLSRIAVAERHRGRGVGRELLAHYESVAQALGARRLVLEVSPSHEAAIRLYERAGFAVSGSGDATDPATGRRLVYHHMTRPVSAVVGRG